MKLKQTRSFATVVFVKRGYFSLENLLVPEGLRYLGRTDYGIWKTEPE